MLWRLRPVRVAVIGCGGVGDIHLKSLSNLGQFELIAAVDIDRARAQQAADKYRAKYALTELDQALAMDEIEAVIIATPNYLHEKQVVQSLQAGKHVFVEKPLGLSMREVDHMIEVARQSDWHLTVGQMQRYWPNVILAREMISEGRIGEVKHVVRRRLVHQKDAGDRSWGRNPELSGGWVLYGNAVHEVDAVLYMTGLEISEVTVYATCNNPYWNDIDEMSALVRFESGAIGTFIQTLNADTFILDTVIVGEKGCIRLSQWSDLWLNNEHHALRQDDGYASQLVAFAHLLRRGEPHRSEASSVRPTMMVLEAMAQSLQGQRTMPVTATGDWMTAGGLR